MTSEQEYLRKELLRATDYKLALERLLRSGRQTKDELRRDLKVLLQNDKNIIDISTAKYLLDNNIFAKDDFVDCGIDSPFLPLLKEEIPKDPTKGIDYVDIQSIAPGATEVYFWGIPQSGKTCALGAVMSVANNGGDTMHQHRCQGGDYMSRLAQVFRRDGTYTFLPAGTSVSQTFEMRFSLIRDKKEHPLALIDMSGELFTCFYKIYTNKVLNEKEQRAFDTLHRILVERTSENRKIHFFVVEYGSEDEMIDGLRQDVYLQRAAEYLNSEGVFKELTDAIYIIITKADKAGVFNTFEDEQNHFQNYMSNEYSGFYWALQRMCEENSINGGNLEFVPFSIGKVVFQKLCRFNAESAKEILDYIVERSFYVERSALGRVIRVLRK